MEMIIICVLYILGALAGVAALYLHQRERQLRRQWLLDQIHRREDALEELRDAGMETQYLNAVAEINALLEVLDLWG